VTVKLALVAVMAGSLAYGFSDANMPSGSGLLWLAPALLLAAMLIGRATGGQRKGWAVVLRSLGNLPVVWYLVPAMAVTSFVVAERANGGPPPDNYWPLFGLWLLSVAAVGAWALSSILFTKQGSKRGWWEWLRTYRWDVALVVAVTSVALVVRIVNLSSIPSPYSGDEANFSLDAISVMRGQIKNMFASGLMGHPALYHFTLAGFFEVFGVSVFASRLLPALAGAVTVPLFYLLLRSMFGRLIASVGAIYLVGYHFHLHFSRIGLNNIGEPLIVVAVLLFAWRACQHGRRADFVLLGLVAGLGLYFSVGGRIAPLIAIALLGLTVIRRPAFLRDHLSDLGLMVLAYGVSALPLGVFWIMHPNAFMDRLQAVGIFQSGWFDSQREMGRSSREILVDQFRRAFWGFISAPEPVGHYGAPIAFVGPASIGPFVLGFAWSAVRFWQPRYFVFLVVLIGSLTTGGALTIMPPASNHVCPTIPAVAAFVAIGLVRGAQVLFRRRDAIIWAAVLAAACTLLALNLWFYFFRYYPGDYYSDTNTRIAQRGSELLHTFPIETRLFLYGSPAVFTGFPTMRFLLRDRVEYGVIYDVFEDGHLEGQYDGRGPAEVPAGPAPAVFLFPPYRSAELGPLVARCPGGMTVPFSDKRGRQIFIAYEMREPNRCLPAPAVPSATAP